MKYIIYMDVFFMVNLVMDTLLLRLASVYLKPQTTFVNCMVGGAVGSLLASLSLLISYDNIVIHMLISYIFTVAAMVLIAFGKCNKKQFIRRTGILYVVTVMLGGAMNLVYNYTYFGYVIRNILGAIHTNPLNIARMLGFTGIAYIIINALLKLLKREEALQHFVEVTLVYKGQKIMLKGLIDTGNSLVDPYCGKPVHIAEYRALQGVLEGVDIYREKYRLVPFHSLGQKNGLLEVIEVDEILVTGLKIGAAQEGDSTASVIYAEKNPAIGLSHECLSGDKKYEMLLHSVVNSTV